MGAPAGLIYIKVRYFFFFGVERSLFFFFFSLIVYTSFIFGLSWTGTGGVYAGHI